MLLERLTPYENSLKKEKYKSRSLQSNIEVQFELRFKMLNIQARFYQEGSETSRISFCLLILLC